MHPYMATMVTLNLAMDPHQRCLSTIPNPIMPPIMLLPIMPSTMIPIPITNPTTHL